MIKKKELGKPSVQQAISNAEKLLPGVAVPEDEIDPRWQAIIDVGGYIQSDPDEVWNFILKWGKHPSEDLRAAISTCLLEHLLEFHFNKFFPMVREICYKNKLFADTFSRCSQFGQAKLHKNSVAFIALQDEL
jgi:hypothetical protein